MTSLRPSISRIAGKIDRLAGSLALRWRRLVADGSWEAGENTRLEEGGRVINIQNNKSSISVGTNGGIRGELLVFKHNGKVCIGDWFYLGPNSAIWSADEGGISIGDRVLISHGVNIHDSDSHPMEKDQRFRQTKAILTEGHPEVDPGIRSAPVKIGNDVWIGLGSTIMRGVTIGNNVIIGAQSVIKSDVPADTIVPARSTH